MVREMMHSIKVTTIHAASAALFGKRCLGPLKQGLFGGLLAFMALVSLAAVANADTLCAPGTYSATGSTPCTAASPGYYVSGTGATAPTAAPAGYYAPNSGMSAPLQAPLGYYVPYIAQTHATAADPGFYVSRNGQDHETAAPAGYFVPTAASIGAQACAGGSFSYGAAPACRGSGSGTVGPDLTTSASSGVISFGDVPVLTTNQLTFLVTNAATGVGNPTSGYATELAQLTDLTLLSATLQGGDVANFSIADFVAGTVVPAQDGTQFTLNFSASTIGNYSTTLLLTTDQGATFGGNGQQFSFTIEATATPLPATLPLFASGLGVVGLFGWRRKRKAQAAV